MRIGITDAVLRGDGDILFSLIKGVVFGFLIVIILPSGIGGEEWCGRCR